MAKNSSLKFIDIGANLTDLMFTGTYRGKVRHSHDLGQVLCRAWENSIKKIIITGSSLEISQSSINIAQRDERLFSTVGCHPTYCNEIEQANNRDSYFQSLLELCKNNRQKVVALGEMGLDFDRLEFCSKETQMKCFEQQLVALQEIKLPLFLHCRNAANDFYDILSKHRDTFIGGVVHSFDGSEDEAKKFIELGLHIGINGCSLKTPQNLDVIKCLPSDKLLIETDSPWCGIKSSHAGSKYVKTKFSAVKEHLWEPNKLIKGRNEPCNIIQVLEIISAVREEDLDSLADTVYQNTEKLFFSNNH